MVEFFVKFIKNFLSEFFDSHSGQSSYKFNPKKKQKNLKKDFALRKGPKDDSPLAL